MSLYKISQVAKKFNISRTALIHYDQCGLLSPSKRNEKNYRYYSQNDLNKLELILALKESGLSIKEIKAYFDQGAEVQMMDLLSQQQDQLKDKIKALKKQEKILKKRLDLLKVYGSLDLYEGILQDHYPPISMIRESVGYGSLMSFNAAKNRLKDRSHKEGVMTSKFAICFDLKEDGQVIMNYVCDQVDLVPNSQDLYTYPASDYVRCLHHGSYHTLKDTLALLLAYAKDHHLRPRGQVFFVPLLDYWELKTQEDFINEVLLPVTIS